MEAEQAIGGAEVYMAKPHGDDSTTMPPRNSTADFIINRGRAPEHKDHPPLRDRTAKAAAGSPFLPGRNSMVSQNAKRPAPASSATGAKYYDQGLQGRQDTEAGPSRPLARAGDVAQSRQPLRPRLAAEATRGRSPEHAGPAAPGARYALSKSPETQNGPPLRTPTPASTRPRVMSPQLVEDDDRPHQPGTRSRRMFPTAGPPANSLTRPTASSQRQQRQSDSRSRSPKKPPEYLQAFNPAALEADPISEFSDDEPTIVEAPDFQPRGRQSSRQARSPSKPEAPASSSSIHVPSRAQPARPSKPVLPSSNLPLELAITQAYCDPVLKPEPEVLRKRLEAEKLGVMGESCILSSGPHQLFLPIKCIRQVEVCLDPSCPSLAYRCDLGVGPKSLELRKRLERMLCTHNLDGRAKVEQLHHFWLHFCFIEGAQEQVLQLAHRLSAPGKPSEISLDACNLCRVHCEQAAKAFERSLRVTRRSDAALLPLDSDAGVPKAKPRRRSAEQPRPRLEAKPISEPKGKGKQKADADQSTLSFSPRPEGSEIQPVEPKGRRRTRISDQHQKRYHEGPIDSESERPKLSRSPAPSAYPMPIDRDAVLFPYPLEGRSMITVTKGDRWRVESGEYLNDTVLEWGLKHALVETLQYRPDWDVHIFNSFFYNKIGEKNRRRQEVVDGRWAPYDSVRKWTKSTDIFRKRFVLVPINEDQHWYLAAIYNPGAILNAPSEAAEQDATSGGSPQGAAPDAVPSDDPQESADVMYVDNALQHHTPRHGPGSSSGHTDIDVTMDSRSSPDPLDCASEPVPGPYTAHGPRGRDQTDPAPLDKMQNLSIEPNSKSSSRSPVPAGQPIDEALEAGYRPNDEPAHLVEEGNNQTEKKIKDKDTPLKLLDEDRTWIFTFDSLGSSHKGVANTLCRWLACEANDKKNLEIEVDSLEIGYVHAQVPLQGNFSDCGLYLVHYARRLLSQPDTVLRFLERKLPSARSDARKSYDQDVQSIWGISRDHNLRQEWVATIDSLQSEYERIKAEKGGQDDSASTSTSRPATSTSPEKQDEPRPAPASEKDFEEVPATVADVDVPDQVAEELSGVPPTTAATEPLDSAETAAAANDPNVAGTPISPAVERSTTLADVEPTAVPHTMDGLPRADNTDQPEGSVLPDGTLASPVDIDTPPPLPAAGEGHAEVEDTDASAAHGLAAGMPDVQSELPYQPGGPDAQSTADDVDMMAAAEKKLMVGELVNAIFAGSQSASSQKEGKAAEDAEQWEPLESPLLPPLASVQPYQAEEQEEHHQFGDLEDDAMEDDGVIHVASASTPRSTLPTIFLTPNPKGQHGLSTPLSRSEARSNALMGPPQLPPNTGDAGPSSRQTPAAPRRSESALTAGSTTSSGSTARNGHHPFQLTTRPRQQAALGHAGSPVDSTAGHRIPREWRNLALSPTASSSGQRVARHSSDQPASPSASTTARWIPRDPPSASSGPRSSIPPWQQDQADRAHMTHLESLRQASAEPRNSPSLPRGASGQPFDVQSISSDSDSDDVSDSNAKRMSAKARNGTRGSASRSSKAPTSKSPGEAPVQAKSLESAAPGEDPTGAGEASRIMAQMQRERWNLRKPPNGTPNVARSTSNANDHAKDAADHPHGAADAVDADEADNASAEFDARDADDANDANGTAYADNANIVISVDDADESELSSDGEHAQSGKENDQGDSPDKENEAPFSNRRPAPPRPSLSTRSRKRQSSTPPRPPSESAPRQKAEPQPVASSSSIDLPFPGRNSGRNQKRYAGRDRRKSKLSLNPSQSNGSGGGTQTTLSFPRAGRREGDDDGDVGDEDEKRPGESSAHARSRKRMSEPSDKKRKSASGSVATPPLAKKRPKGENASDSIFTPDTATERRKTSTSSGRKSTAIPGKEVINISTDDEAEPEPTERRSSPRKQR